MAMSNQYTLYHLHSDLSNGVTNIDSVTKYGEYIERAKECGMKAMAFTEHGSVFEWWHTGVHPDRGPDRRRRRYFQRRR